MFKPSRLSGLITVRAIIQSSIVIAIILIPHIYLKPAWSKPINSISVEFDLNKSSFSINEPIFITFEITNNSDEVVEINPHMTFDSELVFRLTEPDGDNITIPGLIQEFALHNLTQYDPLTLQAGQSYKQLLVLNDYLELNQNNAHIPGRRFYDEDNYYASYYKFRETGKYKLLISYKGSVVKPVKGEPHGELIGYVEYNQTFDFDIYPRDQAHLIKISNNLMDTALHSESQNIAESAAIALSTMREEFNIPNLEKLMREKPETLGLIAAKGLARLDTLEAILALKTLALNPIIGILLPNDVILVLGYVESSTKNKQVKEHFQKNPWFRTITQEELEKMLKNQESTGKDIPTK